MRMQQQRGNAYVQRYLAKQKGAATVVRRRARVVPKELGDPRPGMMWQYNAETKQWEQQPATMFDENGVPIDIDKAAEFQKQKENEEASHNFSSAEGPYQEYADEEQDDGGANYTPAEEPNYTPSEEPATSQEEQP